MATVLWLDDRPIEDLGLAVSSIDPWWHAPGQQFPMATIPGRRGQRASDRGAPVPARRVPLVAILDATDLADRLAKLDALALALAGLHEVRVSDDPERVAYCTLENGSLQFIAPQLTLPEVIPSYDLVFADPHKYDRRPQMLVAPAASQPKLVPCGSVPHRGRLWVMDQAANRTVEVLAGDGTVVGQLRLTGTLATNEYLEIDMDQDAPTITHVQSSGTVRVDAIDWLNKLDPFPTFDPRDRPSLRHTGGGDLVLFYRRGYHV